MRAEQVEIEKNLLKKLRYFSANIIFAILHFAEQVENKQKLKKSLFKKLRKLRHKNRRNISASTLSKIL